MFIARWSLHISKLRRSEMSKHSAPTELESVCGRWNYKHARPSGTFQTASRITPRNPRQLAYAASASFNRGVDEIERLVLGFKIALQREHVKFERGFVSVRVWINQLDAMCKRFARLPDSFPAAINRFLNYKQQTRQTLNTRRVLAQRGFKNSSPRRLVG